jgi:small subunit ribosomal protein S16
MLKIRLQRVGRKHEPVFRLVLTDSQNSTKSGRYLEVLGSHDARNDERTQFDTDRIKHWISKGAQPTETVHNMLINKKIIEGKKINVLPRRTPIKKESEETPAAKTPAAQATPAPAEATAPAPAKEEAPADQPSSETTASQAETPASA